MRMLLCVFALALAGCTRPPAVDRAAEYERRVQANIDTNSRALIQAQRETFRAEARAHAETLHKWSIERVRTKANADPEITKDHVIDEMEARRRQLEANRDKADLEADRMKRLQAIIEEDRVTRERIRSGLDEYESRRIKLDQMVGEMRRIIKPPE